MTKCHDCSGWGDQRGRFRYCDTCGGAGVIAETLHQSVLDRPPQQGDTVLEIRLQGDDGFVSHCPINSRIHHADRAGAGWVIEFDNGAQFALSGSAELLRGSL